MKLNKRMRVFWIFLIGYFGAFVVQARASDSDGDPVFRMVRVVFAAPSTDVSEVYAFPVPFKPSLGHTNITFINLPSNADIRIFTIDGKLAKQINHSDASGTAGKEVWDVTNSNGEPLGSDVFYYMIASQGQIKKGKLLVIR